MRLERWRRRGPRGTAQVEGFDEKRAAAHDTVAAGFWTLWIVAGRPRVVVAVVPVLHPLHDVAGHVERAIGRGVADRLQVALSRAIEESHGPARVVRLRTHVVGVGAGDRIAPGIPSLIGAARGL